MLAVQRFATAQSAEDRQTLQAWSKYAARMSAIPALAVFFLLLVLGGDFVTIAFGAEYSSALDSMLILTGGK